MRPMLMCGRSTDNVAKEFSEGRARLARLFGERALQVFAPPWHGFDGGYFELLKNVQIKGFSTKGARASPRVMGLIQSNIHCVPIMWTSPPTFGEEAVYVEQLCAHLRGRRLGQFDRNEPTGILTHHLVQDEESFLFMERVRVIIDEHPAAIWVAARDIFLCSGV